LRSAPEEEVKKSFSTAVLRDFSGTELPEAMGLEPLTVRDQAWRHAHTDLGSCGPLRSSNPPPSRAASLPESQTMTPPGRVPELERVGRESTAEATPASGEGESQTGTRMSMQTPVVARGSIALIVAAGALAIAAAAVVVAVLIWQRPTRSSTPRYLVVEQGGAAAPRQAQGGLTPTPGAEPSGAASPSSAAPPPAGSEAAGPVGSTGPKSEGPDAVALTRAFSQQMGPLRSCLDQHRGHLGGTQKLSIFFSIDRQGAVEQAALAPAALAATPMGECVLTAARAIRFGPQPQPASFRIPVATGFQ
jgi:hypothetical protein